MRLGGFVRAVIGGLFLAGIVHIVAILQVPKAALKDATGRVLAAAPEHQVTLVPADGSVLPDLDPFFLHAVCPYAEADRAIEMRGAPSDGFWTLAIVSRASGMVASFERGAFPQGRIELAVGTTQALERIRIEEASSATGRTTVDVPPGPGFVMVRASAADPEARAQVRQSLTGLECGIVGEP